MAIRLTQQKVMVYLRLSWVLIWLLIYIIIKLFGTTIILMGTVYIIYGKPD